MKELTVYYEDIVGLKIQDRYDLVHFVKAGGSSGVFAAYDRKMDRRVAVKLLPPTDPMMAARFEREAMTLSKLHHPNTLTVFDFGRTPDNYLYMVMELLEGETLKDVMRRDQWFAPRRAVHIVAQICRSLWNAHQHGVVHRDIKPSNIFLVDCDGDSEFVKVLDFGVAKLLHVADNPVDDGTQVGRIIGTPRYMAPEQISSDPVDARADMYSTGIMLYEMLCGVTPFQESSLGPLLMLHLNEPPPRFSTHNIPSRHLISDELERAVMRSLAKDPRDRFTTIDEMRVVLEAAVGGMSRISMDGARLSARLGAAANDRGWTLSPAPPPVPDDPDITGNRAAPSLLSPNTRSGGEDDVEEALVLDDHVPDDDENQSTSLSVPPDMVQVPRSEANVKPLVDPVSEILPPLTKTQAIPRARPALTPNMEDVPDVADESSPKTTRWLWAAVLALVVGAGGAYFFLSSQESASDAGNFGVSSVDDGKLQRENVGRSQPQPETSVHTGSAEKPLEPGNNDNQEPIGVAAVVDLADSQRDPEPTPDKWNVRIVTEPNGANVYHGIQRIGTTPFEATITELMWEQKLRFERPEYVTFEASVPQDVQQSAKTGGNSEWVVTLEPVNVPVVHEKAVEPLETVAVTKPKEKKATSTGVPAIKSSRAGQKAETGAAAKSPDGGLSPARAKTDKVTTDGGLEGTGQNGPKAQSVPVISSVEKSNSAERATNGVSDPPKVQIIDDSVKPSAPKLPPAPKDPPIQKPKVELIQ